MSVTRRMLLLAGAPGEGASTGSDVDLLQDLLAIERRLVTAYESGLRRGVIAPSLGELMLAHEREHVRALEETLAGRGSPRASVPEPALGGALRGRSGFASYALALEAEAVEAYARAAANLRNAALRQPLGSIMACEAAHGVALRNLVGDRAVLD